MVGFGDGPRAKTEKSVHGANCSSGSQMPTKGNPELHSAGWRDYFVFGLARWLGLGEEVRHARWYVGEGSEDAAASVL